MAIRTGCDWLTVTTADHRNFANFERILQPIIHEQSRQGFPPKTGWRLGYYGYGAPHYFVGRRDDGTMVQVSSEWAARLCVDLCDLADNCSRIDLQITTERLPDIQARLAQHLINLKEKRPTRGRPQTVKYMGGRNGLETLYVGAPASDERGRVYDKGEESGQPVWESCLRYEVQFRGRRARVVMEQIRKAAQPQATMVAIVRSWYTLRGVDIPELASVGNSQPEVVLHKTSTSTQLHWLESQVSPVLARLVQEVSPSAVAVALTAKLQQNLFYREWLSMILEEAANYTDKRWEANGTTVFAGSEHMALSEPETRLDEPKPTVDEHVGHSEGRLVYT